MPRLRSPWAPARALAFATVLAVVVSLGALPSAIGTPAATAAAKLAPGLLSALDDDGRTDLVVEFADRADLTAAAGTSDWDARGRAVVALLQRTAAASQADVVTELDAAGVAYQAFWVDNTVHVDGANRTLALDIAADDSVVSVREPDDVPVEEPRPLARRAAVAGVEWGLADIGADRVWEELGVRGGGVVVANIDSGVQYDHPALRASYRGTGPDGTVDHDYNWWDPSHTCPGAAPCDNVGHGTHTMGTMVGDAGEGNRIGVAPGARWIAAKGCETQGCSETGLTSSAQWVLAPTDQSGERPDPSMRPQVVNNSWSGPGGDDWFEGIVDAWLAAGIFPVFSNGNTGPECETTGNPAEYASAYAVGNHAPNGQISATSSRGPGSTGETKPDVSAPGTAVRSSVPGGYAVYSGTSMAAPHVAGSVALLWSAAPALVGDVSATRQLLDDAARDTADGQCGGEDGDNNVYGEGRLDAFAAVEAAPRGDTGRLSGRVTDTRGEPVGQVRLRFTGASTRTAVTDDTGRYGIALTPGRYEVAVTRYGFDDVTTSVTVTAGKTVRRGFSLVTSPRVGLSGVVTDRSGGWPVYAKVHLPGTPLTTYTDPATGRYRLTVPSRHSYRVRVTPEYAGYAARTDDVAVPRARRHDVTLTADAATCMAPGYDRVGGLATSFDRGVGTGWTVQDSAGTGQTWTFDDPGDRGNLTGGHGRFAVVDSDHFGADGVQDTSLVSPVVDLRDAPNPVLEFATDFWANWLDRADVDVTVDGGATWTNVWRAFSDARGPRTVRVPVPQAANQERVQVRFHYLRGSFDWWWQVDDVFLGEPRCAATAAGLVVGHTRDSVTRRPLVGATVQGRDPVTAVSVTTPDDDATADGLYWLPIRRSGPSSLVASADDHAATSARVKVRRGHAAVADVAVRSARLRPAPGTTTMVLRSGEVDTIRVRVTNDGDTSARFGVEEVPGVPRVQSPAGRRTWADGAAPALGVDAVPAPGPVVPGPPPAPGPAGAPDPGGWGELAPYPFPVRDSVAASHDGVLYVVGGADAGQGAIASSFRYDGEADAWVPIADLPQPRQRPAGGFVDGRFVVTGGWGSDARPVAATSIYDPATDSWSAGAPNPTPWAASGQAVLDGALYVVGGCLSDDCGRTDVLRYDIARDTWTRLADYPQPTAWTSCGAIRGRVYCAGGIGPGADQFATFAYDPATDRWTRVADLPLDMWASAHAVVDGRLVVATGAAERSSVLTNAAFAYDPFEDEWQSLPPTRYPGYRSAGGCGFAKVGGAQDRSPALPVVEHLPGGSDCVAARDLPWLDVTTAPVSVPAHARRWLRLRIDTRGLAPGTYDAFLRFADDTPFVTPPMRVRVIVRRR